MGFYAIIIFSVNIFVVLTQNEKPGSCPPPLSVDICYTTCEEDLHCRGSNKCCATECGGTFCVEPITMRSLQQYKGIEKYLISISTIVFFGFYRKTRLLSFKSVRIMGLQ